VAPGADKDFVIAFLTSPSKSFRITETLSCDSRYVFPSSGFPWREKVCPFSFAYATLMLKSSSLESLLSAVWQTADVAATNNNAATLR
jgi:hypothetical protein